MRNTLHDGHRERLRRRFEKEGLENFEDHNVLELLLFYTIPRRDTNEIAHRLINTYGTLARVIDAPLGDLQKIEGIGKNSAIYLKLISETVRRYLLSSGTWYGKIVNDDITAVEIFRPYFLNCRNEVLYMLCLNWKEQAIACLFVAEGSNNAVIIDVRNIVERALYHNAAYVILAHNHCEGTEESSVEDNILTREVWKTLKDVGIVLRDHFIITPDSYKSMKKAGHIPKDNDDSPIDDK